MRRKVVIFSVMFSFLLTYSVVNAKPVNAMTLKKGERGTSVEQLQEDLKSLGYFSANCTGYYGDITVSAVKKFQADKGLTVDGIAGKNTLSAINSLLSTPYKPGLLMKKGMQGSDVEKLQQDLKRLGYFQANVTGFYGDITVNSVKKLQKEYGLHADGITGENTLNLIGKLLAGGTSSAKSDSEVTRSSDNRSANYLMAWFGGVENIFKRGATATVYDIDTGISFKVKRSYGTNHADCEPLTAEDAAAMKKAYGGSWNWARRAIVVKVDGYEFAASMNGMPHAGLDSKPEGQYVSGRAGGYGYGYNYDSVKGNNFDGHFCIHFYNSRTHGSNKVDSQHSQMMQKAARWLESR
jgi:peptidoglycan hydrolase-like protein with peptidoglycan-binding domain